MPKKRADAIVNYPDQPMVVASVATTASMMVLTLGDGREEHYTYPPSGHFHITANDNSGRSFFAPGPAYNDLSYHRLALIPVPLDQSELVRKASSTAQVMLIPPPSEREGLLEVGVLGQRATPTVVEQLKADGALLGLFQGPRSDTTIVLRYTP